VLAGNITGLIDGEDPMRADADTGRTAVDAPLHDVGDLAGGHSDVTAALVGHTGAVTQDVDNDRNQGAIRLDEGEVWTARTEDGAPALAAGTRIEIIEIRGATAVVKAAD